MQTEPEDRSLDGRAGWIEIHRARRARACREPALVLAANDIPFVIEARDGMHVLSVPEASLPAAREQLELYLRENKGWPPRFDLPPAAAGSKWSPAAFAGLIVLVFALDTGGAFGLDWHHAGRAQGDAIQDGAWWRAVTSLTLHADLVHVLSNAIYGALFGFLVAYVLGGGLGWLTILWAGVLGNLTNAWLQSGLHISVGASTAVFGAVGVLAGSEWRRLRLFHERRLRRIAPVVIAFLLLALLGIVENPREEGVDVMAHFTGLVWGIPLGWIAASYDPRLRSSPLAQGLLGLAALACIAVAWVIAFRAG